MNTQTKIRPSRPFGAGAGPSSLTDLLRRRADEESARVAYTFLAESETEATRLTYGELDLQARAIAAWLQSHNGCGERALLLYPQGLEFIAAFFGCLYAGVIAVAVYPPKFNHSLQRLQAIAADAGAEFVLTTEAILSKLEGFAEHLPLFKRIKGLATDRLDGRDALARSWQPPAIDAETLAFLQYTSGSTATPKGVMVSHGNILHNSAYLNAGFDFTRESTSLSWAPHFHDMGLILGLIQPLFHGFHGIVMSPAAFLQRPYRWLEAVTRYGVTHTGGPNFAYDLCVRRTSAEQRAELDLSRWRVAYNGAEPVRVETLKRFAETFAPCGFRWEAFNPAYGLAEATLKVSSGRATDAPVFCTVRAEELGRDRVVEAEADEREALRLVSSGHAKLGMQVRIVHPEKRVECAPEEVGEIWVSGPSVAKGYWNKPEETEKTFHARLSGTSEPLFLRTGDLGFLRGGELFVTGRLKDLVIINGRNHYPQDIEQTVEACHTALRTGCCAAFSVESKGGERLVVVAEIERQFLQRRAETEHIFEAIRRAVAEQHELEIEHALLLKPGRIPKTTSGKLQRHACRASFLDGSLEPVAQWPPAPSESAPLQARAQVKLEAQPPATKEMPPVTKETRKADDQPTLQAKESSGAEHAPANSSGGKRVTAEAIQSWLIERLASALRIEPSAIDTGQPFASLGLGSVQSVGLSGELADWLGRQLPPTLLYEHPTIAALSTFLAAPHREATEERRERSQPLSAAAASDPIAIIGIGCRFPGADGPEEFWRLLREGRDAVVEYPPERRQKGTGEPNGAGRTSLPKHQRGGFLKNVEQFDAQFFSISPLEAASIDPQQRLLMEVAWEALERAGQSPAKLAGSQTGVFIGISSGDYQLLRAGATAAGAPYFATGNAHSIAANRLSYFLNLHGPSMAIDTACSSSLVAVHLACQSLRHGESNLALAGGVNLLLNPQVTEQLARAGMLSPEGLCQTFDADADGYVRAEGCGIVVLKRLSDALRDGDEIIALIKASAINQDGRSNGLTAPNGLAQQTVIRQALRSAGVSPSEIDFVEAHGSGTSLGDPIEVNSLIEVLGRERKPEQVCFLGSVKANVGHMEAAAGVAGLIKAALALRHGEIPPQVHLKKLNPHILLGDTAFRIPTRLQAWPASAHAKRAGVSSFGFGGTNAHVVLEEAPAVNTPHAPLEQEPELLTLSARTENALHTLARNFETLLREHPQVPFKNICFTANTGRAHFSERLAVVAATPEECREKLRAFLGGEAHAGLNRGRLQGRRRPKAAFIFTGENPSQTAHLVNLHRTQKAFRDALAECEEILRERLKEQPLGRPRAASLPASAARDAAPADASVSLAFILETKAAGFVVQYALARMWTSWGVVPEALTGYGAGKYAAACIGGALGLEDALIVCAEPASAIERVQFKTPCVPIISTLTGHVSSAGDAETAGYWSRLEDETAQVESGARALFDYGCELLIDLSLTPERAQGAENNEGERAGIRLKGQGEWPALLATLAQVYTRGIDIDWEQVMAASPRRRVPLPTYPFERKSYWLNSSEDGNVSEESPHEVVQAFSHEVSQMLSHEAVQVAPPRPSPTTINENGKPMSETKSQATSHVQTVDASSDARKDEVLGQLTGMIAALLHMDVNDISADAPFLEMGADSIVLVNAIRTIENTFDIKISIRQLFEQLTTIDALASHIALHSPVFSRQTEAASPVSTTQTHAPLPNSAPPFSVSEISHSPTVAPSPAKATAADFEVREHASSVSESALEQIMRLQLEAFSRLTSQQLEALQRAGANAQAHSNGHHAAATTQQPSNGAGSNGAQGAGSNGAPHGQTALMVEASPSSVAVKTEAERPLSAPAPSSVTSAPSTVAPAPAAHAPAPSLIAPAPYVPHKPIKPGTSGGLSARQAKHLADLIERYTKRTPKSKQLAQATRPVLADSRASVGFRLSVKEMLYPITGERSGGSRIWDVDGNEYIDVTMGFGVHLFGHGAPFIRQALEEQLSEGIQLGPRSRHVREVAELLCQLTGHERVAFCNSGTEAVMTALRLARAATGRSKIALFAGSYHGHSDGTLAIAETHDGQLPSIPMAPGVPKKIAEEVVVLEYGSEQALSYLKSHLDELACVLVEPVQSRNPGLQPREFLHALREMTERAKTPLIFDEMVTGFRVQTGGAQAWFGVKADLATYGKIIGGGLPIGVVAGKAAYMDGIDGGMWQYGDASYPRAETTFFGGTFCMHPLSIAAARATLRHLKAEGTSLLLDLNRRTSQLMSTLNDYFAESETPMRVANFGSLFRFIHAGNMDLFYYHLLEKGIYIWEWRSCFLSTVHSDEDLDHFTRAVKESLEEMREGGFLPQRAPSSHGNGTNPHGGKDAPKDAVSDASQDAVSDAPQGVASAQKQLPLTEAQKQLWLLGEMDAEASLAYHESVVIELKGSLDLDAMREAFRAVVNRHEALRTAIDRDGLWQKVVPALDIEVPLVDFTENESDARERVVEEWFRNEARKGFDLAAPPLLRASLLRVEQGRHLLVLTAHHIVIDSWSLSVVLQDVAALYTARRAGAAGELARPAQFGEYLRQLSHPSYVRQVEEAEAYWLKHFAGETPALSLPTSRVRPDVKTYRGAKTSLRIEAELSRRLKAFGRRKGCTLFMTLLAGYTALLHRLTGQEELVIGIPVSGRFVDGSEYLVGYCTHMLPVRSSLPGASSFEEHLRASRSALLEAYEHQQYPFANLINKLNPRRDLSRTPIIQTSFNLEPNPTIPNFAGLESSLLSAPLSYTKFDLGVNVLEINGELQVEIDYNTDLFESAFIARLAEQFRTLLAHASENPAQRLAALSLMPEAERRKILVEWNETETPFPATCVHRLIEEQARQTPEATAVVFQERQLTYRELNEKANRLARQLRSAGLRTESRVGICVERSAEMMVGLLGILKAGCAYVPLDPEYPRERLSYMLADSGASALLTQKHLAGLFTESATRILYLDEALSDVEGESAENLAPTATAENLAYVIYTSGSTGRPKGVQVTHSAFVNFLSSMQRLPGLTPQDTLLAVTTVSFDIAALELFLPLTTGARLVVASRDEARDGEMLAALLTRTKTSVMQATPATWRLLIEAGWKGNADLKILCGGEALPRKLAEELLTRGASLWNLYGPTETTIWSALDKVERGEGPVSIGRPLANTQIYLLDAHLEPVPVGVAGELYIAGAGLARGYLARPDLTAERFVPHPFSDRPGARLYRTGDLARHHEDGRIELLGRADYQVKVRGFRIELGEIEAALCSHEDVREAAVVVRENEPGDQRLVAFLGGVRRGATEARELAQFLRQRLPEYMIPSSFVRLDALPRYPNGKVNRAALPAHEEAARPAQATVKAEPQTRLEQEIAAIWKDVLKLERVGLYDNFFDIGGHSLLLAQVHRKLKGKVGTEISLTEMFRHPTVSALAARLNNLSDVQDAPARDERHATVTRHLKGTEGDNSIAIVGMTGRFPGAKTLEEFWRNLREGVESISFFDESELEAAGTDPSLLRHPRFVRAGAVLDDVEMFDAAFFGFNPREAEITDPQHRLFLECAWEALENAGYDSEQFRGLVGVYASVGINSYLLFNVGAHRDFLEPHAVYQTFIGNDKDFVPSRVSYKLNLKGPSVNVQTACSSSLVAVHMACRSLLDGECEMALAGGVAVKVPQKAGYLPDEQGIDSPDGHCRAFDAKAAGTIFGSGVGVVVLKRLSDALRDGDHIHAVIKGSAINNDGSLKVSYTAPSEDGQSEAIAKALAVAQVEPQTIGYIETHGTGTPLGDPIEMAALKKVFQGKTQPDSRCAVGAVKTNVGHLDTAAGIAGLIKTVLSLKAGELPPSLHFEQPNPHIDFVNSPFYVVNELRQWPRNGTPRRAGVSSFGIGGTNAHVVLEESPDALPSSESEGWQMLVLSAKTETALERATANLLAHLKRQTDANLADIAYTLQIGRRSFDHRRTIVCKDAADAVASIESRNPKRVLTAFEETKTRPVAFLFPGQGTQHVQMAREIYETQPTFKQIVDECAELLRPRLGLDLRSVLYPEGAQQEAAASRLDETWLAQPALFVIEYALARLWMEWGVKPQAMIGHSVGEYVAACLSGVFSHEDALALIAARGKLMQSLPGGAMLAVPLAADEVLSLLDERLSLAAVNGVAQCVVSGEGEAVEEFERQLAGRGVACTRLHTSHAFHSRMMEPILERFAEEVGHVKLNSPRLPYISNLTGTWITPEEATSAHYWARHLRETVQFAGGFDKLLEDPQRILLEVGPGQSLSAAARRHPRKQRQHVVVSSMRHRRENESDAAFLLTSLGRLWLAGVRLDWQALHKHERRRRVPLPTYPFERQRYWIDPPQRKKSEDAGRTDDGRRSEDARRQSLRKSANLSDWFYLPCWRPTPPVSRRRVENARRPSSPLVLVNDDPASLRLLKRLEEEAGGPLPTVKAGERLAKLEEHKYVVNPQAADDYRLLFDELRRAGQSPEKILHLWTLSTDGDAQASDFEHHQRVGYRSLLNLGKVLGSESQPREIIVVSNGLQSVSGEEALSPEKATLLSLCRTIGQEYPGLTCRSIDIVSPEGESWQERKLSEQLVAEFDAPVSDVAVAYRNGSRWVEAFERASFDAPSGSSPLLRERGVYLITGGLGRIGLALAGYLTRAVRAKLVLVGRSTLPPRDAWEAWLKDRPEDRTGRTLRRLLALEEAGAELYLFDADVTDEERMREIVERVEREAGSINGVIHAAGLRPEETFRFIREMNAGEEDWPKHPKVGGLIVLEKVLRGREVDFCLLISSLASVLGGLGYTAYSAANLFMDAFARKQNRLRPLIWSSVNCDAWSFDEDEEAQGGIGAGLAEMAMTADEGVRVFERLLATGMVEQVVISTADLHQRIEQWSNSETPPAEPENREAAPLHPRPQLPTDYLAPRNETERSIAEIWKQLLGVEQVGVTDSFFNLGGDSLLAVQLTSRIRAAFKVAIGPRDIFDAPTVEALAKIIADAQRREQTVKAQPIAQAAGDGAVPLSFAQQQLWVACHLSRAGTAFNIPCAALLRGPLNVGALERTLNEIVRRHQTLRTYFPQVDGLPIQVVAPSLVLELPLTDLRELPAEERLGAALRIAREEASQPFDLARLPLLRPRLLRTGDEEHVLLVTMHHIVTDGWSMGVLINEVTALYEAFAGGAPSPLKELSIQYADFARWQRRKFSGELLDRLLAYWKGQLGELPRMELRTDRPRSSVQTFRAATCPVRLPAALTKALKDLSRRESATLFMTLTAAFNVLLGHHSAADKIVLGTDVANRQPEETEKLIGFFVNQLVLLTDISGELNFLALLARVRQVALGAFTHQELPFEMLIDALKPEREATRLPIFQVKFALQNAPQPPVQLSNIQLNLLEVENPYAKCELLLTLREDAGELTGTFEYQAELFDRETVEGMAHDYVAILQTIAAQPDISLSSLKSMLAESARERAARREQEAKTAGLKRLKTIRRKAFGVSSEPGVGAD